MPNLYSALLSVKRMELDLPSRAPWTARARRRLPARLRYNPIGLQGAFQFNTWFNRGSIGSLQFNTGFNRGSIGSHLGHGRVLLLPLLRLPARASSPAAHYAPSGTCGHTQLGLRSSRHTAKQKLRIVTLRVSGWEIGEVCFATPADFPRHEGTPYRRLRARRWGLGFVHRSRIIFCRAVTNPSVTIRNFFIAVRQSNVK
jgi:hypothetical protein